MTNAIEPPPIPAAIPPAIDLKQRRSVADAWMLFAVAVLLALVIGSAMQLCSLPAGLALTEILLILLPAIYYVRRKRLPLAESLRWRRVSPGLSARAAVLGVTGWGMAASLALASNLVTVPIFGPDPSPAFMAPLVAKNVLQLPLILLVAALLPGICEETLFRGALQGTFERRGPWKAVVIVAAIFAVFHMSPWNLVPVFALGLMFGAMALRTNSIVPSMITHALNNVMAFTLAFLFGAKTEGIPLWLIAGLAVLFVPAFWEFLRHTRRVERVPSPLTQAPAGLPLSTKLIALTAAAGLVVVLVAAVVLARLFVFEAYVAVTDDLAPQIQQDDTVLLLKNRWSGASIKPGDVVAFHRENKTLLRKVARADDTSVWVIEKTDDGADAETRVPRSDVVGRMLTIVPGARNRIETKD